MLLHLKRSQNKKVGLSLHVCSKNVWCWTEWKFPYQWIQTPPQSTGAGFACCCRWRAGACRWRSPCRSGRAAGGWSHLGCSRCSSAAAGWHPERRARSPDKGRAGLAWALRSRCPEWRAGSEVAAPSGQQLRQCPSLHGGAASARTGSHGSAWSS